MEPIAAATSPEITSSTPPASLPESAQTIVVTSAERAERRAARAQRSLTPPPPATAKPDATTAPATRELSGKQKEINERATRAVDSATATLQQEVARLKKELETRTAPPAATVPPPAAVPAVETPKEPTWKRIAAMPDAPKLKDFETLEEYNFAASLFVNEQLRKETADTDRQRGETERQNAHYAAEDQRIRKTIQDAIAADPEFPKKLTPLVANALKPIEAITPAEQAAGVKPGPINLIGKQVYQSDLMPALLVHFSQPAGEAELKRLCSLPPHLAAMPRGAYGSPEERRIAAAHIEWMLREFGALEATLRTAAAPAPRASAPPKLISSVPAPAKTLGTKAAEAADPKAAAIRTGDTRSYRQIRREERAASRMR